jgi:DNA invertase Pin-like site-specific DNA recombinase
VRRSNLACRSRRSWPTCARDLVVVDKLDRWSRDPEFTYASVRKIREVGASFYSVSEQCDPATSEGDTMLNFRVMFAREEHKRIRERMVGTRQALRERGWYVEGLPPFGYRRSTAHAEHRFERNVLVIEPTEAALVRRAFAMCINGRSISQIAERLELKRDRVSDVLRNRVYLGEMRTSARGGWTRGKHDAIVDANTFERAREAREARTLGGPRVAGADAETATWILRDVATCLHCGARMGAAYAGPKGKPGRRHYYRCTTRCTTAYVRVRDVEAACEPMIVRRLSQLRDELARGAEPMVARAVDTAEARRKLAGKRARLVELYADGLVTRAQLGAQVAKLDAEVLKLERAGARRRRR